MQFNLRVEKSPERFGGQMLMLERVADGVRVPITDVTQKYNSGHPYHSQNDSYSSNTAQLFARIAGEELYVVVYETWQGPGTATSTDTRAYVIRDAANACTVAEIPPADLPPADQLQSLSTCSA